jgi:excinuclease ABC subunit C
MPSTLAQASLPTLGDRVRASALNRPGVYRMIGERGVVIYVGKSKRVRTRLLGYFWAKEGEKAWRIIREARALEWEYTPSEFGSLLRELELIKRYRPRFNVRQKRDGLYSFLKVTQGPAPKLLVVRRVVDDGASYVGPLRGGKRIVEAVRELNDAVGLRDCQLSTPILFRDQPDLFSIERSPLCARFELRRCAGPCAARCSEREYAAKLAIARGFLEGEADDPVRELDLRMKDAADRWEFEHAAALRERMERLEMLRQEVLRLREALEDLSFVYVVPGHEGEHLAYVVRSGSIREVLPVPSTRKRWARLLGRASEHLERPEAPSEAATRGRVDEILLLSHWFRTRPGERARCFPQDRWGDLPLSRRLSREQVA